MHLVALIVLKNALELRAKKKKKLKLSISEHKSLKVFFKFFSRFFSVKHYNYFLYQSWFFFLQKLLIPVHIKIMEKRSG